MITKRTKMLLGLLVLVALGAYAYLYWWSMTPDHGFFDSVPAIHDASQSASDAVIRPQPQPVTPGVPVPPASQTYRTYQNTEFGFSFSYPDNWNVSQTTVEDRTTVLCLTVTDSTGGCLATVSLEKEGVNASADIWLKALNAEYRDGKITESERRIAGKEATQLRVTSYPAGKENNTRASVFVHDTRVYSITGAAGQEAVYDRITSSFAFQD